MSTWLQSHYVNTHVNTALITRVRSRGGFDQIHGDVNITLSDAWCSDGEEEEGSRLMSPDRDSFRGLTVSWDHVANAQITTLLGTQRSNRWAPMISQSDYISKVWSCWFKPIRSKLTDRETNYPLSQLQTNEAAFLWLLDLHKHLNIPKEKGYWNTNLVKGFDAFMRRFLRYFAKFFFFLHFHMTRRHVLLVTRRLQVEIAHFDETEEEMEYFFFYKTTILDRNQTWTKAYNCRLHHSSDTTCKSQLHCVEILKMPLLFCK